MGGTVVGLSSSFRAILFAAAIAISATLPAGAAADGVVVEKSPAAVGVNPNGQLIADGPNGGPTEGFAPVGISFFRSDALEPGCHCEGWGAGDALTQTHGYIGENTGREGIRNLSFSYDAATGRARSVTKIPIAGLRVFHNYRPGPGGTILNKIRIRNTSDQIVDARYRRTLDWDVPPTEFREFVTIDSGDATGVLFTSDDGFAEPGPFSGRSMINFEGNAEDDGPDDHGALFDFGLGLLAPGESATMKLLWGAAADEAGAKTMLGDFGAEAYSLGQPSSPGGAATGEPNTFVFAARGVGGTPLCSTDSPSCAPIDTGGGGPDAPGGSDASGFDVFAAAVRDYAEDEEVRTRSGPTPNERAEAGRGGDPR